MGDEELNFTEEEAQCWADDPRNQPRNNGSAVGIVVVCVLLLVAFIAFVLATGSGRSKSDGGVAHGGETHAGMVPTR
jgi:hypothetical protein